ncbi:MAG TPA: DUF4129 domain-containing protein [Dermatophilaceae bacterium]|nr:DUF4129 domain-containing protein [Dermatophilaceae bacterium]
MTRRGTLASVGAAVLVMAALLAAALADPVQVLSRPRSDATSEPLPQIAPSVARTAVDEVTTDEGVPTGWDASIVIDVLTQVLLALVFLGLLFGLAVLVQSLVERRPHLETAVERFPVPAVPEELLRSAESRMALLESGEPRNAIVAAWLDLEAAAAASGLPRHPAETSTEYTTRVITTWQVDRERLDGLAALYREARFSLHPLGEEQRRRAIDNLRVLHDELERAARLEREDEPS